MAPRSNRRPGNSRRAQYGRFLGYVIAVAGIAVALVLLLVNRLEPSAFSAVRGAAHTVTTPISGALARVTGAIASVPDAVSSYFGVRDENRRLRQQLHDQGALLTRARSLSRENHRLMALLQVRERVAEPVTTARLVSSTGTSTRRYAILNAGAVQGVHTGQSVRGPDGLIGQVMEVGPVSANVLLLVDPSSQIPVRRARDGLPAIVQGRGDGVLDVHAAEGGSPLQPGDLLVTSGAGGIYPPDVPVARIVRRNPDGTALAVVIAQPDTLDFALVQQAYSPPPAPVPSPTPTGR